MRNFLKKLTDDRIKAGLVNSIWDGVLWAIMFGFAENYIAPFALAFGATPFQVSLIQGMAQIGVGLGQLSGAQFILRYRKRQRLAILCSRFHAISWLFVFFVTWWTGNPWWTLVFYFLGFAAANFGGPAWLSWMNDLVPSNFRGEFWGIRNKIIGFTQFLFITLAGVTLYIAKNADQEVLAYGGLLTIAFAARFANFIPLSRQYEPPMLVAGFTSEFRFVTFLSKLFTTNFGRFALFSILMTFSINIMGPIVPVYMFQELHMNYLEFTIITMTAMISSFMCMTYWGRLADKYGNYRVLFVTAIALPVGAVAWIFLENVPALILIHVVIGFVFAGFNLATTNFIFDAVRRENISKIMAYFNTLNTFCAFLGAFTGGLLVKILGHHPDALWLLNKFTLVFAISGVLRLAVFCCFIRNFKEVRAVETSPDLHYFYVYRPALNMINRFQLDRYFRIRNGNGNV